MTDNQKVAYKWAKNQNYPSVAAKYAKELAGVVDDLQAAIRDQKWISVKDRLPDEKQRVLVRCKTVGTTVGWRLWGEWLTDLGDGGSEVTNWMPLPELLEEGDHAPD